MSGPEGTGHEAGQELERFPFDIDLAHPDAVTFGMFRDAMVEAQRLGMSLAAQGKFKEPAEGLKVVESACGLFPEYEARLLADPIFNDPDTYL